MAKRRTITDLATKGPDTAIDRLVEETQPEPEAGPTYPTQVVASIGPRVQIGNVWWGLEIIRYPVPGYKKAAAAGKPVEFGPERIDIVGRDQRGHCLRKGKPDLSEGWLGLLVAMRDGLNDQVPVAKYPSAEHLRGAWYVDTD